MKLLLKAHILSMCIAPYKLLLSVGGTKRLENCQLKIRINKQEFSWSGLKGQTFSGTEPTLTNDEYLLPFSHFTLAEYVLSGIWLRVKCLFEIN